VRTQKVKNVQKFQKKKIKKRKNLTVSSTFIAPPIDHCSRDDVNGVDEGYSHSGFEFPILISLKA
jgi:hypothetical protein